MDTNSDNQQVDINAKRKRETSKNETKLYKKKCHIIRSFDFNGDISCGCCKNQFFTKSECRRLIKAENIFGSIKDKLEKLEEENRKRINDIYDSSSISIIDLYITNPNVDKDAVKAENERIEKLIKDSIHQKNFLQESLKRSSGIKDGDDELVSRIYHIEKNCVVNCCQNMK